MKAPRKKSDEFHWDPPDREWLYKVYVELDMTCDEIGYLIGASPKTVRHWLGLHRISKRLSNGQARIISRDILLASRRPKVCHTCGKQRRKLECHHIDGDVYNYSLDNLIWLCRRCHNHSHSRLTKESVYKIRELLAEGRLYQWEIARIYGVSQTSISYIKLGRTWAE